MIAVSTPRIQRSKSCFSGAPRHGGQDMQIRAIMYDDGISSAKAKEHTFEQSASRCTGVYR
jgi:hypothetical protein